jgi:MFS family permease
MIGDRVPARRMGLATGVFYAGVPVGFALSFALSGAIAPRLGWRACFLALGTLGLAGALLVLRLADPPRRGEVTPAGEGGLGAALRARPLVLLLALAGVLLVYASASSQHAITWLVSERGFDYARAAWLSAGVTLLAGLAGNLGIGAISDRARRAHPAGRLLALAAVSGLGLLAAAGFYTLPPSSVSFLACWFAAQGFLLGWYGPLVAAVDELSPASHRGAVIGLLLLLVNLLGVTTGPFVTGWIGDRAGLARGLLLSLLPAAGGALLLGLAGLRLWRESR